ncbi:MAG: hypothetical protein IPK75_11085 [Acidobacteria bacterium]|nr:hypothetical protein [Acidobacteriota bacterium]
MIRASLISALSLLAACATAPETAAQSAAASPPPPCSTPAHHAFDFWIGEWDVFNAAGNQVGTNTITREEYGCLLVEHWTDANGITGQSYNFLDPSTDKWRQLWISGGEVTDFEGAPDAAGVLRLDGVSRPRNPGGTTSIVRGTWTANPDGTVTQHFERQDPATGSWSDTFVGTYVRKDAP